MTKLRTDYSHEQIKHPNDLLTFKILLPLASYSLNGLKTYKQKVSKMSKHVFFNKQLRSCVDPKVAHETKVEKVKFAEDSR